MQDLTQDLNNILRKKGTPLNELAFVNVQHTINGGLSGKISCLNSPEPLDFEFHFPHKFSCSNILLLTDRDLTHLSDALDTPFKRSTDLSAEQNQRIDTIESLAWKSPSWDSPLRPSPESSFAATYYFSSEADIRDKNAVQNGELDERLRFTLYRMCEAQEFLEEEILEAADKLSPVPVDPLKEFVHTSLKAAHGLPQSDIPPAKNVRPSAEFRELTKHAEISYQGNPCKITLFNGSKPDGFQCSCTLDFGGVYRQKVSASCVSIQIDSSKVQQLNAFGFYSHEQSDRHDACLLEKSSKKPIRAFQQAYKEGLEKLHEHDHHYKIPNRFLWSVYEEAERYAMKKMALTGQYSNPMIIHAALEGSPTFHDKAKLQECLSMIQSEPTFANKKKAYQKAHVQPAGR